MAVIDGGMNNDALTKAKEHVYNVCQSGDSITLIKPETKDRLGAILTENVLGLKAHPVRFSPFDREVMQKISWAENVTVIFYISVLELDLLELTIKDLKHYTNVKYRSRYYEIAYIESYSAFFGEFLYVLIGAKL